MSRRAKIVIAIAAGTAVACIMLFGALAVGGFLFFRHSVAVERAAVQRAVVVQEQAVLAQQAALPENSAAAAETPAAPEARPAAGAKPDLAKARKDAIARAVAFQLKEQGPDGSWATGSVGITALVTDALLTAGKTLKDPEIRKAVDFIAKAQKDDGGIYDDVGLKTYCTSIALMALVDADAKAYAPQIEKAKKWLKDNQWDEGESIDRANPWYGGHGYGKHERPDLSNTQFFVEAMHKAGVPKDDPLWGKVVVFLSRTQDRSESNDNTFVGTDSGGFIYSPNKGGESMAGTVDLADGKKGLKAYGSMTYAGFKSFIYANLNRDDPRVKAALDWVRKHWTWDENPELGPQGLYYYYQTAAKALKAYGDATITDSRGRPHDWRTELTEAMLKRQKADGSWLNDAERWYEGEKMAAVPTSYCIVALVQCE